VIALQAGGLSLGVEPRLGASIAWFRQNGTPLLRDTPADATDERDFSALPLVPFSNRIRHARFMWAGETYVIARDAEDPRHALHGTSRFYPWRVAAQSASTLRCELDYTPQNLDWPFAYHAWQDFELLVDRLRVRVGLRNTHATAAPAGIGLHPYFFRAPRTALRFDAAYVWEKDAQDIPLRSIPDAGRFSFENSHELDHVAIDNDYGGWGGVVDITAPGRPRLTLTGSGAFTHLVLFTPDDKPYFAAEPVTHRPDAINPNGDPRDETMSVLAPGEVLAGEVEILLG